MTRMTRFFNDRPAFIPALIAAVMLFAAIAKWPYGYYVLLRWVVCAVGVLLVVLEVGYERRWALWPFALIALLFNPLVPVYLTREIWLPIDVVAGALFVVAALALARPGAAQ